MHYIFRRLRSVAAHLRTLRGLLIVLASILAVISLLGSGTLQLITGIGAVGLTATLLLIMSLRLQDYHPRITSLDAGHGDAVPEPAAPTVVTQERTVGSSPETRRDERLDKTRAAIVAVRGQIAAGGVESISSVPTSDPVDEGDQPKPAITIVVPLYNESRFVGATLESLRRQTFTDWECIVVDDASTDNSVAAARRFTKIDNRMRLVRHKVNGGLSAARNTGLRLARGRYVTFLDSDDMLMRDSLIDRLETIAGTPKNVAGAFCGVRQTPEDASLDDMPDHEPWPRRRLVDFVSSGGECPFNAHAPLLRTSVVRDAGGFDESMRDGAEDWDLWLRIMRQGYVFVPSQWITAVYRQKRHSMAKAGATNHIGEAHRLIAHAYAADSEVQTVEGVHAFPLALPEYEKQLVVAKRAVQYAATSLARGDIASAEAILADPASPVEEWMDRHLDFDAVMQSGFRRAFGVAPSDVADLREDLQPLNEWMHSLIRSHATTDSSESPTAPTCRFETLLIPENTAQAIAMLDIARALPNGHSVAFLNTERVSGAQGVADIVAGTEYPQFSLNEWILHGYSHARAAVSFPRSAATEELLNLMQPPGVPVVELNLDGTDVMAIDDRPGGARSLPAVDVTGLATWLTTTEPQDYLSLGDLAHGAGPWVGAHDPDPDGAWIVEEYPDTLFDAEAIAKFKNIHEGERCVIIGNGPSLNEHDLTKLAPEYTIGVNGIFYAADRMGFDLSYYVVEDTAVMADNLDAIRSYSAGHKFFPSIYRDQVGEAPNVTYFMMNRGFYAPKSPSYCVPRFSTDASQRVYSGQSVTIINLQLAYHMGFSEVVLIGMDFSYTVPDDAKVEGVLITSMGDDPNHFHPDYFGKGKVWKDPKLDRVLANYQLAKLMYEADGRRIVNATAGGKLELFDRVPYEELFG